MKTRSGSHVTLSLCLLAAFACADSIEDSPAAERPGAATPGEDPAPVTAEPAERVAEAALSPTEGHEANGSVTFTEVDDGVRIAVEIEGLGPGPHGFHVHETGDCSAPDASSAGDHFAPADGSHGSPSDSLGARHVGDLGNLVADAEGLVRHETTDPLLALSGERSIVDRAVVVHAGEDDLETDPAGGAGEPVACGVIAEVVADAPR